MPLSTISDGRLVEDDLPDFTDLVTGIAAVVQRVFMRLSLHRGEWVYDPDAGLPWNFWMSISPPPLHLMEQTIRDDVASIPGMDRVLSSSSSFAISTRVVTLTVNAVIENEVVELTFRTQNIEYGNVSPYITYRVLGAAVESVAPF